MITQIVIVEDDKDLSLYLKELLTEHDYSVRVAHSGVEGLEVINKFEPDLILLDLTLPDMSGEGVCMEIRKNNAAIPIIMLTAKDNIADKVHGLSAGADDYITKPFVADELLARIKTRLRNTHGESKILKVGDLVLDTQTIEVKRAGKIITLTPQEFKLLEYLMNNKGIVLTRDMILNRIWLYSPDVESRVVDVYMGYLRKKIDGKSKHPLLHSVRGFGYTIKD